MIKIIKLLKIASPILGLVSIALIASLRDSFFIYFFIAFTLAVYFSGALLNIYNGTKNKEFIFLSWDPLSYFKGKFFVVFRNERAKQFAISNFIKNLFALITIILFYIGLLLMVKYNNKTIFYSIIILSGVCFIFMIKYAIKQYYAFYNPNEKNMRKRYKGESLE